MTTAQREIDLRIIHSLRAYIERLEKERDDLVAEGIHREAARWSLMVEAVAGQRDKAVEAVELLLKGREWSMGFAVIAEQARTLAGLNVQPCKRISGCKQGRLGMDCQFRDHFVCAYHGCEWPDREKGCPAQQAMDDPEFREGIKRGVTAYREGRMRPWSEVEAELGIEDPPCERVSVCCEKPMVDNSPRCSHCQERTIAKCAIHDKGIWILADEPCPEPPRS